MTTSAFILVPALARDYLVHHRICPKSLADDGSLVVAVAENSLFDDTEELSLAYNQPVVTEPVPTEELDRLIERLTTRAERSIELARADASPDDLATDVRDLVNQPPVIRYVNLLVRDAYDLSASDIHLEATRTGLAARFRVDGVLVPAPEPPSHLHLAVVSRIKLLAELDIAERRRPQDGRIRVRLESRELDLRVSTVPTMYGESVVFRLLDHGGRPVTLLTGLGGRFLFSPLAYKLFARGTGVLNSNDYVRLGWSWYGTTDEGREVLRIAFGNAKRLGWNF